jgi:CBS domain-containing protein
MANGIDRSTKLTPEEKRFFREQLRRARAQVLGDSESFESIVRVIEQLGRFLKPGGNGFAKFRQVLGDVASRSALSQEVPKQFPGYHLPFPSLFERVREGRNSAVHEGAAARHLTTHALELALILEDALMPEELTVSEFMVRGPVVAAPWQPVSFVRQQFLTNSFSYLPVRLSSETDESWRLVSDVAVAALLAGATSEDERRRRLTIRLREAVTIGLLKLDTPVCVPAHYQVRELVPQLTSVPALVVAESTGELVGIVTPFDLL